MKATAKIGPPPEIILSSLLSVRNVWPPPPSPVWKKCLSPGGQTNCLSPVDKQNGTDRRTDRQTNEALYIYRWRYIGGWWKGISYVIIWLPLLTDIKTFISTIVIMIIRSYFKQYSGKSSNIWQWLFHRVQLWQTRIWYIQPHGKSIVQGLSSIPCSR